MSSWFYAGPDARPVGPLTLDALQRLRSLGTIASETYVIEQTGVPGLAWRPYRDFFPDPFELPPVPSAPPPNNPALAQPYSSPAQSPMIPSAPPATPLGYGPATHGPMAQTAQPAPLQPAPREPIPPSYSVTPTSALPPSAPTLPRGVGLPSSAVFSNPEPASDSLFSAETVSVPVYSSPALSSAVIPAETNSCSLFGFLLALTGLFTLPMCVGVVIAPFSLILSTLGLIQLRKTTAKPQTGRGLAIAGIVISCLVLVAGLICIIVLIPSMGDHSPSPIGPVDDN